MFRRTRQQQLAKEQPSTATSVCPPRAETSARPVFSEGVRQKAARVHNGKQRTKDNEERPQEDERQLQQPVATVMRDAAERGSQQRTIKNAVARRLK
jgi:hypothetical protein